MDCVKHQHLAFTAEQSLFHSYWSNLLLRDYPCLVGKATLPPFSIFLQYSTQHNCSASMVSLSRPASTAETLIVPVAPLGFTPLGKALAPTFVHPQPSDNTSLSPQNFGIQPAEWRVACDALSQAYHAGELPVAMGVLQWVPLVVFAGPVWINVRAERSQRTNVYMELARLQQSILRPRNLQLQLHTTYVHRGRGGDQTNWLSISKTKGQQQRQPVLVLTSSHPDKDRKHFAYCRSIYEKCEAKVNVQSNM